MTENNTVDQANPEAEVMNVVNHIADNQRADAIDKLQDLLYARSSDAIGDYKKTVAKTYFNEPVEDKPEEPSNETDNGND
jgi:PHP family Zn ribbon phosphoesterase